jgi:hypothetical protein
MFQTHERIIFSTYEQHVPVNVNVNEVPTLIRLIIVGAVGKPAKTIFKAVFASKAEPVFLFSKISPSLNDRISNEFIARNNEVKTSLCRNF